MLVLGPQYMIYKVCHQGIDQNTAALKRYFLLLHIIQKGHFIFRAEATIRFDVKFSLARTVCSGPVLLQPPGSGPHQAFSLATDCNPGF